MAIDYASNLGWHEGEQRMQTLLRVPYQENPTSAGLSFNGLQTVTVSPLLVLGTLDDDLRPWTSIMHVGGRPIVSTRGGQSVVNVDATVDQGNDPVVELLSIDRYNNGEATVGRPVKHAVSALAIDLMTRSRVKLTGKLIASEFRHDESPAPRKGITQLHIAIEIEHSLGTVIRIS